RITIVSFGEQRRLCRESNEACWAKNRRDMFLIKERGGRRGSTERAGERPRAPPLLGSLHRRWSVRLRRERFWLWPVHPHLEREWPVGRRQPVRLSARPRRPVLDVDRQRAVLAVLHSLGTIADRVPLERVGDHELGR